MDADTWVISLDPSAMWIEEGIKPGTSMVDWMLNGGKPPKKSKAGDLYKVIPLQHNKAPSQSTPKQQSLTDMLRAGMKERGIQYGGLEKDETGKPKLGTLHSFDIKSVKGKNVPLGKSGVSMLQGVRVIQKEVTNKQGVTSVKKGIYTFRVVSSKHKGTDRWLHGGTEARLFMDQAYLWALAQWTEKIVPDLLDKVANEF